MSGSPLAAKLSSSLTAIASWRKSNGRSPLLADARLAEAIREGWLAPPLLAGNGPPPRKPVMMLRDLLQDPQRDRQDR